MVLRLPLLIGLFASVYFVQKQMDDAYGQFRATQEVLYVESGTVLKKMTVGFENIAADLYWLRTVQYFGGRRLYVLDKDFSLLEPLLNITTELDPDLKIAFTYGAIFLSEPVPAGAGVPLKGIELIDRGIEHHPDYWRFYMDKGFIYYWHLDDCEKAAEIFMKGSEIEDAPFWMVAIAGRTLGGCGKRETSRGLWRILLDTAETEQQRDNAIIHLQQLDALDQIDVLQGVIDDYVSNAGRFPADWQELIDARVVSGVPSDPVGVPYELDPAKREIIVSKSSPLGAVPTRR